MSVMGLGRVETDSIGRLLALDSEPARSYGVDRSGFRASTLVSFVADVCVADVCSLRDFSRALYPLAGRRRAPRRISFCTIHRRRWPPAELRGHRRALAAAAAS